MKKLTLSLAVLGLISSTALSQSKTSTNKNSEKMTIDNQAEVPVKAFFDAFGKGDFEGILDTFHPDVTITAVRESPNEPPGIYGTYHGMDGVKSFLSKLGDAFDTQSFTVDDIVGNAEVAYASGHFLHKVKSTDKMFESDWALHTVVKDGKIYEYHFYEDSASFEEANVR